MKIYMGGERDFFILMKSQLLKKSLHDGLWYELDMDLRLSENTSTPNTKCVPCMNIPENDLFAGSENLSLILNPILNALLKLNPKQI